MTKSGGASVTKLLVALLVPLLSTTLTAADVSGVWTLAFDPDFGGTRGTSHDCTFKQDGRTLTGTCGGEAPITGEVNDQKVTFRINTGKNNELTATFVGELDRRATTIKGTWHLVDQNGKRDGKFTASKHSNRI